MRSVAMPAGARSATAAVFVAALLAGCAEGATPSPVPASPITTGSQPTRPTLPTRLPTAPPSTPSDPQPVGVIVGRVTRVGPGPCFGVETDEGRLYAIYAAR